MANKNEGKKIVNITEKNPAPKAPETPENNGQQTPGENEVKYTLGYCIMHPIKAVKHAWDKHPVATGVTGTVVAGGLVVAIKAIVDAIGGGNNTEEVEEDLDDVLEDIGDDDDEEEI